MEFTHEDNRIYSLNKEGKVIAEITFPAVGPLTVNIESTFVDPSLRGQGIADKLVQAAVDTIKAQHQKAIVTCSYAKEWFASHPEHFDLMAKDPGH